MTNPENNSAANALLKTIIPATLLGTVAIGSFVLIYMLLDSSVDQFPRLLLALCLPPVLIGIIIGFYVLFIQKRAKSDE
jgi:predicted membrane protein